MKFKSARYKAKQKTNKTNLSVLNGALIKFLNTSNNNNSITRQKQHTFELCIPHLCQVHHPLHFVAMNTDQ